MMPWRGGKKMKHLRYFLLLSALVIPVALMSTPANAQVGVGIGIGGPGYGDYGYGYPAPVCSWGYYNYYPYACAPCGYYGPSWFVGGLFIGAGPWYRGYWGRGGYYGRGGDYGRGGYYGGGGPRRAGSRWIPRRRQQLWRRRRRVPRRWWRRRWWWPRWRWWTPVTIENASRETAG